MILLLSCHTFLPSERDVICGRTLQHIVKSVLSYSKKRFQYFVFFKKKIVVSWQKLIDYNEGWAFEEKSLSKSEFSTKQNKTMRKQTYSFFILNVCRLMWSLWDRELHWINQNFKFVIFLSLLMVDNVDRNYNWYNNNKKLYVKINYFFFHFFVHLKMQLKTKQKKIW